MIAALFLTLIPLYLHHADTPEAICWGLMGYTHLAENEGMTFTFTPPRKPQFWMFNCKIHLSVAFLDENKVIREIHELEAHPELMDPKRKVKCFRDIALYPADDPIRQFFHNHAVKGKEVAHYALEMKKEFFDKHRIHIGDKVIFDTKHPAGYISSPGILHKSISYP